MCEIACQIVQKKQEEKRIEEEQVAKAQNWKILTCCDDDDDYNSTITPNEPIDSLSMGDEHLDTISAMESDEFIKSCVENLVLNPSESEGENGCDVPACFTTFSDVLFDAEYEFDSNQPHFNAESDLIESLLNNDSSIIPSSSKIDSLLDEFASELTLLKSIPLGIDKTDCYPEGEIHLTKRLLYDNSSPRPSKEFVSENSNAEIESFSPSPIPIENSDSFMEEIDLTFTSDDPMPSGIEEDDYDSQRDILICEELLDNYSLSLTSSSDEDILKKIVSKPLSEEEIIPMESLRTHDSSLLILSMIDYLLEEFAGELTLLKSIPPGIDETDCDFEEDIRLIEKLLYDNSSPRPPEEIVSVNSDAKIKSFPPSPILVKDSDSLMEEIDLFCTPDYPMPPSIVDEDYDSERDILIPKDLPSNNTLSFAKKNKQENDKIGTKPDKNGKCGKAQRCQKSVTVKKAGKEKKIITTRVLRHLRRS
nr:hypothetical protein [Tanacetum cinerariifolium]